jgi:hypothetical protein
MLVVAAQHVAESIGTCRLEIVSDCTEHDLYELGSRWYVSALASRSVGPVKGIEDRVSIAGGKRFALQLWGSVNLHTMSIRVVKECVVAITCHLYVSHELPCVVDIFDSPTLRIPFSACINS